MRTSREPGAVRGRRAFTFAAWAVAAISAAGTPAPAQTSIFDSHFDEVRRASVVWDNRPGPRREVVDMVCLVPDLATFLDVVATWDEHHYFPVLIDDVEYSLKFLRAFRPARVVRVGPRKAAPLSPATTWSRAVAAVGKSWAGADTPEENAPRGDAVPRALGPVPPGVVVSAPDSPSLAAAVALAAGHFQPLLVWQPPKHYADVLSADEAVTLALSLETVISDRLPRYGQLGDDCDFVTLAGDYPYRYNHPSGLNAFDDLILRPSNTPRRWGFAGRITGDAVLGVYQAMCGLFLHPSSALLFNGYTVKGQPWNEYTMDAALTRLSSSLKVTHRNADRAGLAGWHQAFDPINPYGLLFINTHGGPTVFNLDGPGQTADVPESVPTAVLIIHSYSAQSPADPQTIAGRWLANGAFAYYGSMNEPFLHAFRPPKLVTSFLSENLPLVASVRRGPTEPMGQPWRLIYFGDPLYRIRPAGGRGAGRRLATWAPVASWPAYGEFQQPRPEESEDLRLKWALRTAIFLTQAGAAPQQKVDLPGTLLGIARDRLDPGLKPIYDDLLVATLLQAGRPAELIDGLTRIPTAERSPAVRRHLETAETAALQAASAAGNSRRAVALWADVIRSPGSPDFVRIFTERVGHLCDVTPARLADWRDRLRVVLRTNAEPDNMPFIQAELKRIAEKVGTAKAR